jgi:hypothetical protein
MGVATRASGAAPDVAPTACAKGKLNLRDAQMRTSSDDALVH